MNTVSAHAQHILTVLLQQHTKHQQALKTHLSQRSPVQLSQIRSNPSTLSPHPLPTHTHTHTRTRAKRKKKLTIQNTPPTLRILARKNNPPPITQFTHHTIRRLLDIDGRRKREVERRHMIAFRSRFGAFLDRHCAEDEGVRGVEFDPAAFP